MSISTEARDLVFELVNRFLTDPEIGTSAIDAGRAALSAEVIDDLTSVLSNRSLSYRDGVLIQLAYGIVDPGLDLTKRPEGARGMAQQLGVFFADRHIAAVKDAYQNIAKNTDQLARGNVAEFDRLLHWATGVGENERRVALELACAEVASKARPVLPMPELNRSSLTFAATSDLFRALLQIPSGGAYEQFSVAALLNGLVSNHAGDKARIETKSLNASDRSSFAAGDVQITTGGRVLEAFEVTANRWDTKIDGASKTVRDNDLSRLHIIATRPEVDRADVLATIGPLTEDVTVLDVMQVIETMTAILTRPQRAEALVRLYEYLDRYQPDTDRVNQFVHLVEERGLVERAGD